MTHFKHLLLPIAALMSSTLAVASSSGNSIFIDNDGYLLAINPSTNFTPIDPKLFPSKKYLQLYPSFNNPEHQGGRVTGDIARKQAAQLLGNGYDQITAETLANDCWVTKNKLELIETEALVNQTPYKVVDVIHNYDTLTTFFKDDKDAAFKIEFKDKKYYLDTVKDNKQVVENTTRIHEYGVVAFKMRHHHKRYTAPAVTNLTMDPNRLAELKTDKQPAGKSQFRSMCGDKYLSSVTSGRELEGTVRIHRHEESHSQNVDIEKEMKVGIAQLFTLSNFKQIQDNDFVKKHKDLEFQLAYSRIGGRALDKLKDLKITIKDEKTGKEEDVPLLSGDVNTVVELAALIVAFNEGYSDDETLGLVSSQRQDYPIPPSLIAQNKSHFDVFLDYKTPTRKLKTWNLFAGQVAERCSIFQEDKGAQAADLQHAGIHEKYYRDQARHKVVNGIRYQQYDLCGSVNKIIADYQERCSDHNTWADPKLSAQCYFPQEAQCKDAANPSESCLLRANALDKWELVHQGFTAQDPFHMAIGHGLTPKKKTYNRHFCYSDKDILVDYRKSYSSHFHVVKKSAGTSAKIRQAVRLDGASTSVYKHDQNQTACMNHYAEITRPGWNKSGAIYESEVLLHGYKPVANFGYSL